MIAVMLSVCVFVVVVVFFSCCKYAPFSMLGVLFFFFFFFSFQVCLGIILLNHLTPSTKGKVIPKAPKVQ